jgi:hypothetical protein
MTHLKSTLTSYTYNDNDDYEEKGEDSRFETEQPATNLLTNRTGQHMQERRERQY